ISEDKLEKLAKLEEMIEKGKVKIVVESGENNKNKTENKTKKVISKNRKVLFNDKMDATVLTPVLIIGITAGILTGIPLLGVISIILLPIFGVVMMKLFPIFLGIRGGIKKALLSSILSGIFASGISIILLLILEIFTAGYVYDNVYSYLSFMSPTLINTLLGITGFDKTLSFSGLFARFIITIIVYPILLFVGAVIHVKFRK
ncbi:hypothetical protein J7J90_04710, partial [Candidatus Micrarchaeota archaeon]|nr:hypothetical protein [Candidatus Micrarchaeota archaeon]